MPKGFSERERDVIRQKLVAYARERVISVGMHKTSVDELARYVTPVSLSTERYAREDITIAGVTIPHGSLTFAVLSSANHDERRFDQPESLNLQRENNQHFAFGQGVHYCLGAPLARMEAHIAINTLLTRMPRLTLAVPAEQLRWRKSQVIRGLKALPVKV